MYEKYGKRLLDFAIALVAAVPMGLLCVICVVAIRLDSPGPGIFRQTRVGREQRPFILYKLRTMSLGTGDRASHEIAAGQITRIGHVLRRTKLDELPQLYNVLRGEMSLVGPRPCLPSQTKLIAERAKRNVFELRPGVTGPAQLARIDMSVPVELAEADAAYKANLTLRADIGHIIATALGRGNGDAAGR